MIHPRPFGDQPAPESEHVRGMIDPREIHPSPGSIFSDGTGSTDGEPVRIPPDEETPQEEDVRGMIDPRSEAAGADI
jgi:hypothetical protein